MGKEVYKQQKIFDNPENESFLTSEGFKKLMKDVIDYEAIEYEKLKKILLRGEDHEK